MSKKRSTSDLGIWEEGASHAFHIIVMLSKEKYPNNAVQRDMLMIFRAFFLNHPVIWVKALPTSLSQGKTRSNYVSKGS